MIPPGWSYGLNGGSLITMLLGIILGATLGTFLGTEIAYRRTEKWIRQKLTDPEFRSLVVDFMKRTAGQFEDEYIRPKIESEEFRELVRKAKEQAVKALFDGADVPKLEDFLGGGEGD